MNQQLCNDDKFSYMIIIKNKLAYKNDYKKDLCLNYVPSSHSNVSVIKLAK